MINIENAKTGERYAVLPKDFHKQYEPQGFKALGYESGEPYEAPAKKDAPTKPERPQDAPKAQD